MRILIVLVAVAVLAGCATYSEVATRPASYSATTSKSPRAYAECLLPKLMDTSAASHIVARGDALDIVVPADGVIVMMTFTISPAGNSTTVEMRHGPSLSAFRKQWKQAQSCL